MPLRRVHLGRDQGAPQYCGATETGRQVPSQAGRLLRRAASLLFNFQIAVCDRLATVVEKNETPQITGLGAQNLAGEEGKDGKSLGSIDERSEYGAPTKAIPRYELQPTGNPSIRHNFYRHRARSADLYRVGRCTTINAEATCCVDRRGSPVVRIVLAVERSHAINGAEDAGWDSARCNAKIPLRIVGVAAGEAQCCEK